MGHFTEKEVKDNFLTPLWVSIEQYKRGKLTKEEFLDWFYRHFESGDISFNPKTI